MTELIKNYHFNNDIDERLREMILRIIYSSEIDSKKFLDHLDEVYLANKNFIYNPSSFLYKTITNIDLSDYKHKKINSFFPSWILGNEIFRGFVGEEIDRYLIAGILEYVVDTHQKENGFARDLLYKIESYCSSSGINTWDQVVQLMINSNCLNGCIIPVDEIREKIRCDINECNDVIENLSMIPGVEVNEERETL